MMIDGELRLGLELDLAEDGTIIRVGPQTGMPEPCVLSPGFVNAHSHLEYRGLLGFSQEREYGPWIRAITEAKLAQNLDQVAADARLAAQENWDAGVRLIGEHSDRPVARQAVDAVGLEAVIFQEVITFNEQLDPTAKLDEITDKARAQNATPSPHALHTVDDATLRALTGSVSIHIAETAAETEFFRDGTGPIAAMYDRAGFPPRRTGRTVFEEAQAVGLVRPGVQLVHGCDLAPSDLALMATVGVFLAHCPRSNQFLNCPSAPIREALDAGVIVGLGLDSVASSGPIDMFAEMRAALAVSRQRGRHVQPEEVWQMATTWGAQSLGRPEWKLQAGSRVPLILIESTATSTEELIESGGKIKDPSAPE